MKYCVLCGIIIMFYVVFLQPLVVRRTCCPARTQKPQKRERQRPRNTTWRWKITSPFPMTARGEYLSNVHTLWLNNVFSYLNVEWLVMYLNMFALSLRRHGDYPMLPDRSQHERDPWYQWDHPDLRRNWGEPVRIPINPGSCKWHYCTRALDITFTKTFCTIPACTLFHCIACFLKQRRTAACNV